MLYFYITLFILVISYLIFMIKLYRKNKTILLLSQDLDDLGMSLSEQKSKYSNLTHIATDKDSHAKLKRMKEPHYKALRHINSIIRNHFYSIIGHHNQATENKT